MKNTNKFFLSFFVIAFIALQISVFSQSDSRSQHYSNFFPDIRNGKYDREVVEFIGTVTSWERVPQSTTVEYWVRDDWGEVISVICRPPYPETEKRYKITGIVTVTNTEPLRRYIVQESRLEITSSLTERERIEANIKISEAEQAMLSIPFYRDDSQAKTYLNQAQNAFNNKQWDIAKQYAKKSISEAASAPLDIVLFLIILSIVILVLIVILLVIKFSENKKISKEDKIDIKKVEKNSSLYGETVKYHVPPPGTLKVLPGKFLVTKGESKVNEIRLFKSKDNPDSEYLFSRNMGSDKFKTIQIDDPTVSREQAKLFVNGEKYLLINKADPNKSNATIINGRQMELNENHELKPGDVIVMGTIELTFSM